LSTNLLSSLTSILGLNTGEPELEVEAKSVMKLEGAPVQGPTSHKGEPTEAIVVLSPVGGISVQVFLIAIHLFLRINILEELSSVPPAKRKWIRISFLERFLKS
jgi:hypothetical protein